MGVACTRIDNGEHDHDNSDSEGMLEEPRIGHNPFKDKVAEKNNDRRERHQKRYEELYSESDSLASSRASSPRSERSSISRHSLSSRHSVSSRGSLLSNSGAFERFRSSSFHDGSQSPGSPNNQFLSVPSAGLDRRSLGSNSGSFCADDDDVECDVLDEIMNRHGHAPVFLSNEDTDIQRSRSRGETPPIVAWQPLSNENSPREHALDSSARAESPPLPVAATSPGLGISLSLETPGISGDAGISSTMLLQITGEDGDDLALSGSMQSPVFGNRSPRETSTGSRHSSGGGGPRVLPTDALEGSIKAQKGVKKRRGSRRASRRRSTSNDDNEEEEHPFGPTA